MALIKCAECGHQISTDAKACPSCGAKPPKRTSLLTWALGGLFAIGVIGAVANSGRSNNEATPAKALSPEEAKQAEARKLQEAGALHGARTLKASMKDPESFELKQLLLMTDGTACYTYRAKNSFNATLQSSAVLTQGKAMQFLVESKDGNRFVTTWNAKCAKATGDDLTSLVSGLL